MQAPVAPPASRRATPHASRVETAQVVLPGLTNSHGTIVGGGARRRGGGRRVWKNECMNKMSSSIAMSERADVWPGWDALGAGAAIVDGGQWQIIAVTGGDRLTFLHRLLTARLEGLLPG